MSTVIKKGFTLIELLVVISIIGILVAISIFGLSGARESARDARRKSDIELIKSGLEIYKADCGNYPIGTSLADPLVGTETSGACLTTNTYISEIPLDPADPARVYVYSSDGVTYGVCAALEGGTGSVSCGTSSCGSQCNYKVTNP